MHFFSKIKNLICSFLFASLLIFSPVSASSLNYHDFLLFFWGGLELETPVQMPILHYANLHPSDPLYPFLQKAVAYGYFPNYTGALPLENSASQQDVNALITYAFGLDIPTKQNKNLTFDDLKSQVELLKPYLAHTKSFSADQIKHQVKTILENNYLYPEKLPSQALFLSTGLASYVDQIADPYTAYYAPAEAKIFLSALENNRAGIGVALSPSAQGYPEIMRVISGSSAAYAGLQVGDLIVQVDDYDFNQEKNFEQFVARIRGEKGTTVNLKIQRNQTFFSLALERQKISLPLVSSFKKAEKCYIRIENFDRGSSQQFLNQAEKLGTCSSLAIDLRDNPGGIIDEVVTMLGAFLPESQLLLTMQTKFSTQQEYSKKSDFLFPQDLPVTILINKATASAAEIMTAVLKYYFPQSVSIIGQTSYGKGTMQEVIEFSDHSLLKYTLAFRKVADQEQSIDKIGITPDQELVDDPKTPQDELLLSLGLTE